MHIHPIHTATVIGVDGHPIRVEVDLLRRLPAISIVGLPDGAIRESADRIDPHPKFWIPVSTEESGDKPGSRWTQKVWNNV